MNIVVISHENKILHIVNYGLSVEYTLYNSKGQYLHSGFLESTREQFDNEKIVAEIIEIINEFTNFSEPYIYLYGSNTVPLLSLIKYENNKVSKKLLQEYIQSLSKRNDYFYCQERIKYMQYI